MSMILGGALSGAGAGIVEQANRAREDSLLALRRQWQKEDLADTRAYDRGVLQEQRSYNRGLVDEERARQAMHASGVTDFLTSIYGNESGGRFDADNKIGYVGRGQFGRDRLDDFARAHGIGTITPDAFKANEGLQESVEKWHWNDIQSFIRDEGLDRYIGQTVGGQKITESGMLAAAHLGGKAGMRKYLETGGQYNPADANGTRLSDYMGRHGGKTLDPRVFFDLLTSPETTAEQRSALQAAAVAGGFGAALGTGAEGGARTGKLTGEEWLADPNDPGREIRYGQNENGQMVPYVLDSGAPVTRAKKADREHVEDWSKVTLSAAVDVRLGRALEDEFGGVDEGAVKAVKDEMRRLMADSGITETEAERQALSRMIYEEKQVEETSGGFLGFGGETSTRTERGAFTGQFRSTDDGSVSAAAPARAAPAPKPPASPPENIDVILETHLESLAAGRSPSWIQDAMRKQGLDPALLAAAVAEQAIAAIASGKDAAAVRAQVKKWGFNPAEMGL